MRFLEPTLAAALAALVTLAAGPAAAAPQTLEASVGGKVALEVSSFRASVEVKRGGKGKVKVVADVGATLELHASGGHVELDGLDDPRVTGTVTIEVPAGTAVSLEGVQADLTVRGTGAAAAIETVSGKVRAEGVTRVEIEAVNGTVAVIGATHLEVETVSGTITAVLAGGAVVARLATVSGAIELRGLCGKGCEASLETLSGAARLALDRRSSFEYAFETFSGRLDDQLGAQAAPGEKADRRRGRFGKGDGRIELETFSGAVTLAPLSPPTK